MSKEVELLDFGLEIVVTGFEQSAIEFKLNDLLIREVYSSELCPERCEDRLSKPNPVVISWWNLKHRFPRKPCSWHIITLNK